jgi:hypothetical protein
MGVRPRIRQVLVAAAVAAALGGCGAKERNHDVKGFVQSGKTPAARAVLGSIATYRTTKDTALACSLVTQHFLAIRYGGKLDNCEGIVEEADRFLPDRAVVQAVAGAGASVFVDEPSATNSIYRMRREDGVWKIDDIVEAK